MAKFLLSEATAAELQRIISERRFVRSERPGRTISDGQSVIDSPEEAAEFAVRWSAAENGVCIWLSDHALNVDGAEVTVGGVAEAKQLGGNWKKLDGVTSDVWLVVSTGGTGGTSASVAAEAGTGRDVRSYLIASISRDDSTGVVTVRQYIVGALVLGGGSGGVVQTGGLSGQYEIYRNMYYDMYTHKLMGERWFLTFDNGLLIGAKSGDPEEIFEAVPHQAHVGE